MRVREGQHGQDFVRWISELPTNPALNGSVSIPDYIYQLVSITDLITHIYPPALL
ncbi:hypothetical protein N431DRAFT_429117 [Stipitochalara longipes BDJ]|nr:hypothetical protein N431DRAFT_429117 [Stipitochalara longipes BDJ]